MVSASIRAIAETRGRGKVHFIAHSRGTDVLGPALQQLGIKSYIARTSASERLWIASVVLFAPDIDLDVASSKIFSAVFDPTCPTARCGGPSEPSRRGTCT
ncbi:hypothetical protein BB934_02410 [Microvirga ossetica]|uniref:Uncharacterized protein n=1 Tax=Microvirga ossetica TaxID=1882682 RepID=A0A1B2EB88_9HYPH|nr:alpha/beta hydrolase [Microvirga ossetica]ANY77207.1 hypothetical protein BB934_02410 [Microvirga ossetica]